MASSAEDGGSEKTVLNKYSRTITEPPSQGASQAMLYATGLTPSTIHNPQVMRDIMSIIWDIHTHRVTLRHKLVEALM